MKNGNDHIFDFESYKNMTLVELKDKLKNDLTFIHSPTDDELISFGVININELFEELCSEYNKDLTNFIKHFSKNSGLKVNLIDGNSITSNKLLTENLFYFEKENPFIISFSSNSMVGFSSMQIFNIKGSTVFTLSKLENDDNTNDWFINDLSRAIVNINQNPDLLIETPQKKVIITNFNYPHLGHNLWNGISSWGLFNPDDITGVEFLAQSLCYNIKIPNVHFTTTKPLLKFDLTNELPIFLKTNYINEKTISYIDYNSKINKKIKDNIPEDLFEKKYAVISLRSGNRCVENNYEFNKSVIELILSNADIDYILIDGMNATSISERSSHKNINLESELDLANKLIELYPNKLFSIVGCTVNENLHITEKSSFFVAPWGAGLTKSNWILNKPCYIYSSSLILMSKKDLYIYDSNEFRENANKAWFMPSNCCVKEDKKSSPRSNFNIDIKSFEADFCLFLSFFSDKNKKTKNSIDRTYTLSKSLSRVISLFYNSTFFSNKILSTNNYAYFYDFIKKQTNEKSLNITKDNIFNLVSNAKVKLSNCMMEENHLHFSDNRNKIELDLNGSIFFGNVILYFSRLNNTNIITVYSGSNCAISGFIFYKNDALFLYHLDNINESILERSLNKEIPNTINDDALHHYLFNKNKKENALVFQHWHIGHHIWNELSVADKISNKKAWGNDWKLIKASPETEHYGTFTELFGSKGSNDVTLSEKNDLNEYIVKNNINAIKIKYRYISDDLTKKIVSLSNHKNKTLIEWIKNTHTRDVKITYNIRISDRSLHEQVSLIVDVCKNLIKAEKRVVVFVDGINSSHSNIGTTVIGDSNVLINKELLLYNDIKDELEKLSVPCISLIGSEVSTSISITSISDFYIAPWGAGLAKYAWVCNKKGYVHCSKKVYEEKTDLNIYDNTDVRENARKIFFLNECDVVDDSDEGFRVNYSINTDYAAKLIIEDYINTEKG